MPNITKRQNKSGNTSYRIRVYVYETGTGKQIMKSKTWNPPAGMRPSTAEKEVAKIAAIFEDQVKRGLVAFDSSTKFGYYAKQWIENEPLAPKTRARYWELYERINTAMGHVKLEKQQAHHLNAFYKNLAEKGVDKRAQYAVSTKLKQVMKDQAIREVDLREYAGISITTVQVARRGNHVSINTAGKISRALNMDIQELFEVHAEEKGLSEQTIHHHHQLLSAVLETAKRQRLIPFNVAREHTKAPKVTKKEPEYLSDEEAQLYLFHILNETDIKKKMAILLLLFTGLRLGELCGLSFDDFDESRQLIHILRASQYLPGQGINIVPTKNESSKRAIKAPMIIFETLTEYRIWWNQQKLMYGREWKDKDNRLLVREDGSPIPPGAISRWMDSIIKKHGLKRITPHGLRHTFATLQITSGVDVRILQARTGHAQASTLVNTYSHAIKSAQEAAADALENILMPKAK